MTNKSCALRLTSPRSSSSRTGPVCSPAPISPRAAFGRGASEPEPQHWLDLLVVNGGVTFPPGSDRQANAFPLDETNQLFRSNRGREFTDVTAASGPAFESSHVSRGAVFGDIDNDGDTDVVITNNSGPAQALRNEADTSLPWIGLRLRLRAGGRDAYGATVFAELEGPAAATRIVHTDGSYASARDPRVVIALGEAAKKRVSVVVRWPNGHRERFSDIQTGTYSDIVAATGTRIQDP